ncbi:ThiS family protein [Pelotomaculum sp. FP]|uniref:MoaD/ThiS family protein n=1 Tax=Pelotomaculum sp. FP TaxID=261474 RepID=UPI001066C7B4|nr:MoaD/ThiS family protein [Pelotomaculum sp. FP]TEB16399.1 ThiS family protein [Pelotomaculum sp. FP]
MKITVRAYGMLHEAIGGKKWVEIDVKQGATIDNLLEQFGLNRDNVMNVVKKGNICKWDYIIQENDELELLPVIFGG